MELAAAGASSASRRSAFAPAPGLLHSAAPSRTPTLPESTGTMTGGRDPGSPPPSRAATRMPSRVTQKITRPAERVATISWDRSSWAASGTSEAMRAETARPAANAIFDGNGLTRIGTVNLSLMAIAHGAPARGPMAAGSRLTRRQFAPLLARDGLQRGDGHDVHDILGRTAARKIVGRPVQSLQDGPDGLRAGQPLDQLISNITRIEIGKDQHVGPAGDRGSRGLGRSHRRHQRRVGL